MPTSPPSPPSPPPPTGPHLLRLPDFRRLLAVRLATQGGDGIFQAALASYLVFSPERQASAGTAAAAFATLLLPYSVVGPFAGVVIDRWRRQRILIVANLSRAVLMLGILTLVAAGETGAVFFGAVLVVLSVNRFILASLSAGLPHVVPAARLIGANSLSTTAGTVCVALGGGVGLVVRRLVGSDSAVLGVAALTCLLAAALAARLGPDLLGPDSRPDRAVRETLGAVLRDVRDGARHVLHRPAARDALAALTAHRFFYGISTIATLLLYRNYFPGGDDPDVALGGLALVFAVSAAGFLLAAAITPAASRRWGEQGWMVRLFATAAVVEVMLGFPYTQPTLLGAAFFLGVVAQGSKICVDTLVQRSIEDDFRGRVFSFYDVLFNLTFVAAAICAALILPESGKSYAVLGFIAAGYAATALWLARRRWPV